MTYQVFAARLDVPTQVGAGQDPTRPGNGRANGSATLTVGPDPFTFHAGMPGYSATPLLDCPQLAAELGVARLLVKDESSRLGLPSFKMLGASFATARAIQREWLGGTAELSIDALATAMTSMPGRGLAAATDGNHGRGVARMAALLGLTCAIFVPAGTAASRIADIESEGATVEVVPGSYDDAIARSASAAGPNTLVISDTSWEGYTATPADVIVGYSTMFREIDVALAESGYPAPDLVSLQAGVGSFAAAGLQHYRPTADVRTPRTVIAEPTAADCLLRSAEAAELTGAPGPHTSAMAGLNCGLPSLLAWPVVYAATDVYVSIDDEFAYRAMRALAENGVVAGESGAAGLGALFAVAGSADRTTVGLTPEATVLVINTEGATDPVNYLAQVGEAAAAVADDAVERRARCGVVQL